MTILGHMARLLDEVFGAIDELVRDLRHGEENQMSTEPTNDEPQEVDPLELAKLSLLKVKKNDYCGFGRTLSEKVLKQFIVAQSEGRVKWENGTGCFDLNLPICVTPEDPPQLLSTYRLTSKCLRVCVDGECVLIC
jgi:hypothetical protein